MTALTANLPRSVYRRGVNLSEGYSYAKARENQILNDARANTDGLVAGTAAELLGGSQVVGLVVPGLLPSGCCHPSRG
jgi:hypothetical protein